MNLLKPFRPSSIAWTRGYAARVFNSKYQRPRPGTSEKPPYHAPDPLLNNPRASVKALEDHDLTFIHRPPPTAPSPLSFTTNPSSPLLRPRSEQNPDVPLPPFVRPLGRPLTSLVSVADMHKIKRLRYENPAVYTTNKLAKMFGCTSNFVVAIAALPKTKRKAIRKARQAEQAANRENWSEKKIMAKAMRAKRRELW